MIKDFDNNNGTKAARVEREPCGKNDPIAPAAAVPTPTGTKKKSKKSKKKKKKKSKLSDNFDNQYQEKEQDEEDKMQSLPQLSARRGSNSSASSVAEESAPPTVCYPNPNPNHQVTKICQVPKMRQMTLAAMMRPTSNSHLSNWNHHAGVFGHQFPNTPSRSYSPGSQFNPSHPSYPQNNSPTSFHIPMAGAVFKGRNINNGRLNPRMQSSSDYFGQFHHLMQRNDAPLPIPPPVIPYQYYNYMMHTHLNNTQSESQSQSSNHVNQGDGMETAGSETKPITTPVIPVRPQSPGKPAIIENPSSKNKSGANTVGPRCDAWTKEKTSSVKPCKPGFRTLKNASTTHIICSVCCRKNGRLCSACGHVAYCSVKCQKIDWPRHKYAECIPPVAVDKNLILSNISGATQSDSEETFEAREENGGGDVPDSDRTLLAETSCHQESEVYSGKFISRRYIKKGESIYVVKPIMMASNDKGLPHPPDSILCLECCRWYQSSTGYRCSKCQWAVCSFECENGPLHSKFECPIFVNNSIPPPNSDCTEFYDDMILALRIILMKVHEPDRFQELYQWKDLEKALRKTSKWMDYDNKIITFLTDSCQIFQLVDGITSQYIQTILTLIDAASIVMDDRVAFRETEHQKTFHCAKYVIPNKLLLNEECSPNCKWSIHHGQEVDDCSLRIHAATDIKPGTYLSACFSSVWKYGGSFINRYEDVRFNVTCSCRRCKDPTEFGSFFSGIKCKQCDISQSDGYLLPIDPSNILSDWDCQNKACKARSKGQVIHEEVNKLHSKIKLYQNDYWQMVGFVFENNIKVLHPNHFLLFKACWSCLELFWGSLKGLPFFSQRYEFFNSCTHVAKKALDLLDIILPGASIQRGRILFLLSLAEAYRTLRDYRRYLEWGGEEAKKCTSRPFWVIQNIQREALEILITEPYGSMEHRMAVMLQDTIEDQIDLLCHTPINVPLDHMMVYVLHKIYTRFTSSFYEPSIPLFEDEDISMFVVSTGPVASHLVTIKSAVI